MARAENASMIRLRSGLSTDHPVPLALLSLFVRLGFIAEPDIFGVQIGWTVVLALSALAAWIFDQFNIQFGWFVVAVVLFTALTVVLRGIVINTVTVRSSWTLVKTVNMLTFSSATSVVMSRRSPTRSQASMRTDTG